MTLEGFTVPKIEILLILKQVAYAGRLGTPKGEKDKIDIFSLLNLKITDWKFYRQLLLENNLMTPELAAAINIVKGVNKLLFKTFRRSGSDSVRYKKHAEIVTDADLLANKFITRELLKKFPNYDVVSEEAKKINNPGTKTWYIDPLDGTTNFSYGFPEFATCLALENKGQILLGAIGLPTLDEVYCAEKNKGAWCDGKKIKVSRKGAAAQAMFLLCAGHTPLGRNRYKKLLKKLDIGRIRFRFFSCAGIELSSIASGKADACILSEIHPWDVLSGVILVREAGGRVTNWQGQDWQMGDNNLVATNGLIHEEIIKLTKNIK